MSSDERNTGRRPKVVLEGDVERSSRHRRAPSAPAAIPDVEIDPEETPPPREPPPLVGIEGFESLDPTLQAAFTMLHNVQREHDVAFTRIWDARHFKRELEQMRSNSAAMLRVLDRLSNMPAILQKLSVEVTQLMSWREAGEKRDKRIESTLDSLDKRLDAVERDYMQLDSTIALLAKEISDGFKTATKGMEELETEVEKLEAKFEARIRSLEDTRTAATAKMTMLASIAAVLVTLLYWLAGKLWK